MYDYIKKIKPLDRAVMDAAQRKWDSIAKPLGSLGELEEMIVRLCAIQNTLEPSADKKAVLVMCADNGVIDEGVTQSDSSVTAAVTENFTKGIGSVNTFARVCGADVFPVDIGVKADLNCSGIINRKIMHGTRNFAKEPAMTRSEAVRAVTVGIELVGAIAKKGYRIIATGEMGIGNTTTSSAVLCALTGMSPCAATGRGAGLSSEGLERKINVIQNALSMHRPDKNDIIDVLSKVGGLDICGMCGCFIGGAVYKTAVVIDGFISSVAALCAVRLAPECADYMFASHRSNEPAGRAALEAVGKHAYLDCGMCLGEGTGAVIAMKLFDFALAEFNETVRFESTGIEQYKPLK